MRLLLKDTYLQMIKNSLGSKLFRNLYAEVKGKEQDILRNGDLSCAFFVAMLLHQFKLIAEPHATVVGLVRDLERSGWVKTDILLPGAVVVWEELPQKSGEHHAHIGFALNKMTAISHSDTERMPTEHHITFGTNNDGAPKRRIVATYALEGFL
jgi:hypothetical protein